MAFLKHTGRHNNQKVVILYRKVPGEDHMCLVLHPDVLSKVIYSTIMTCLESPDGQNAKEFADALYNVQMADGSNCLATCHKNGFIKKLQTSQVIVTPTANSNIRLDELNKLLDEMALGEDAIKRMEDLDKNVGMTAKKKSNVLPEKTTSSSVSGNKPLAASSTSALSDSDIAKSQMTQADRMEREASSLLNEAKRLKDEALLLDPSLNTHDSKETTTA